jgi:hypothetical protein
MRSTPAQLRRLTTALAASAHSSKEPCMPLAPKSVAAGIALLVVAGATTTSVAAAAAPKTPKPTPSSTSSTTSRAQAALRGGQDHATASRAATFRPTATFTVLTKDTEKFEEIDLAPTGPSAGDQIIWASTMYDRSGKREIGHLHNQCTAHVAYRTDDPEALESACTVSFVFHDVGGGKGAQLVAEGHVISSGEFPVTGTGPFRYARGQVVLGEQNPAGQTAWTFDLRLR